MSESTPKFKREPARQRKETLILACLSLITEQGVRGATVREIAKRADVTQGLIRHHFSSKEDLIVAAYEYHMSQMTKRTSAHSDDAHASPKSRLAAFVVAGLRSPVVDPASVSLWASFLNKVREDARMRAIHEKTYHEFRDHLETLIADALEDAGIKTAPSNLRRLAIACNAVIDGLWMEGGALPSVFEAEELPQIGLRSVGAIIGLTLEETGQGL